MLEGRRLRCGLASECHLGARRTFVDVRQEGRALVRFHGVLKVGHPVGIQHPLRLSLLLAANVEEEAGFPLTQRLSRFAKLTHLHPSLTHGLACLNAKLTVLSPELTNALTDLRLLLSTLKSKTPCGLCPRKLRLLLTLSKLAILHGIPGGKLFCAHAKLRGALLDVCPSRGARKTKLPRLLGELARKLRGVHARICCKLLNIHARLSLSNDVRRGKLLTRKAELSRLLRGRKAQLARLQTALLSKLLCRKAELTGRLSRLLALCR